MRKGARVQGSPPNNRILPPPKAWQTMWMSQFKVVDSRRVIIRSSGLGFWEISLPGSGVPVTWTVIGDGVVDVVCKQSSWVHAWVLSRCLVCRLENVRSLYSLNFSFVYFSNFETHLAKFEVDWTYCVHFVYKISDNSPLKSIGNYFTQLVNGSSASLRYCISIYPYTSCRND